MVPYLCAREHLAVGVKVVAIRIGRPCWERVTNARGILHDRGERGLESVHIRLRAHRDAQMGGPSRPDAADKHLLSGQRVDQLLCRSLAVQHEEVGL